MQEMNQLRFEIAILLSLDTAISYTSKKVITADIVVHDCKIRVISAYLLNEKSIVSEKRTER